MVYFTGIIPILSFLPLIFTGCASSGNRETVAAVAPAPAPVQVTTLAMQPTSGQATLVFHCQPVHNTPLTSAEATQLATLLANDKAMVIYQCQPFHVGSPAVFVDGRWSWRQLVPGDYEALVDIAADGSTNNTIVNLLNDSMDNLSQHQHGPGLPY